MKISLCLAAVPLLFGAALAQDSKPSQSPAGTQARPAELQTQTYRGTLVDASCASPGGGTGAAAGTGAGSAAAPPAGEQKKSKAGDPGQGCAVSANTAEFALKLDDGRTVPFDSVGNLRAQQALKDKKKWNEAAAAGKPIRAKVAGVMTGEKLTAMSVD